MVQGGEVPYVEMFGTFALVVGAVVSIPMIQLFPIFHTFNLERK